MNEIEKRKDDEQFELSDYVEHDKNYFFVPLAEICCKLCSFKGKLIVQHHRTSHPESEVLISRINPDITEILIGDSIRNREEYDKDHPEPENMTRYFKCPFCLILIKDTVNACYNHISSHTGEYCYHCNHCSYWTYNQTNIRSHLKQMHLEIQKSGYKMVYLNPKISKYVFGYICSECNFIQLTRMAIKEHAMVYHPGKPEIHKLNLNVLLHDNVLDENHMDEIHSNKKSLNFNCMNAVTSGPGETHKEQSDFCPIELATFICQPDLDIKQDFENDTTEMLHWINENMNKTSDQLQTKFVTRMAKESETIQSETEEPRNTNEEMEKLNDTPKQAEKRKKSVEVIEIGPISVIKKLDVFTFHCKIQNCNYSSEDKKAFATHCEIIHKDFFYSFDMGECNICLAKFEYKGKFITVYDVYLHMVAMHKDFFKPDSTISNVRSLTSESDTNSVDSPLPFIPHITEDKEEELSSKLKLPVIAPVQSLTPRTKQLGSMSEDDSEVTNSNLHELVLPYNCKEDGFLSCPFKTLYLEEYLKHVETIHQVDGLSSFSSEYESQKEAVIEGWLAKEVGLFQCGYCKKATVTHQEMGKHQAMFHAQEQCLFYYRKFVPNETVVIPEQVNLEDPLFINHVIHLPNQIHLCNFKLTDGLLSSTSAKLTNEESEVSFPLMPLPTKDIKSDLDQSNISLDEPEAFNTLNEPDSLCHDEQPRDDDAHNDARVTACKLQCKWKDCYQIHHSQTAMVKHIEKNHVQSQTGKKCTCFWSSCRRKLKPFTRRVHLLVHMRVHTGEKPHKCPLKGCNKAYSQMGQLKIHQKQHTGERPYVCQFPNCLKSFFTGSKRNYHQRLHYNSEPYCCQVTGCSKQYKELKYLRQHIKKHTTEKQLDAELKSVEKKQKEGDFVLKKSSNSLDESKQQRRHCDTCKWKDCCRTYHSQTAMVKHIEKNHAQSQIGKRFTCFWSNCPRELRPFYQRVHLLLHMRVHTGEKPYKCPFQGCNKACSHLSNLKVHQKSHTGERPYLCQFSQCLQRFSTVYDRDNHQRLHYDTEAYACQVNGSSGRNYAAPESLRKHMKKHTVDEQLQVKQKSVENKQKRADFVLKKSSNGSDGAKQLRMQCDTLQCKWKDCYKTHHSQTAMVKHIEKNHVRSQTGKKFICFWSSCRRKLKPFIRRVHLLVHMRIHTGEKPHKCPFQGCNKAYSQMAHLKTHQKYHTGERPYVCQFPNCLKSFFACSARNYHQKLHYNSEPYSCQVTGCSKQYKELAYLRQHIKNHTTEEQLDAELKSVEKKRKECDFVLKKSSNSLDESKQQRRHCDTLQCKWKDCCRTHHSQTAMVKHIEKDHVQSQIGKKFTCFWSNCPRESRPFYQKSRLLLHMRVHSGEKPHKCSFQGCKKAYSHLSHLKAHQKSHTGERPHLCQFSKCSQRFSTNDDRDNHQRLHYDTEAYVSFYCSKKRVGPSSLRSHIENHLVDEVKPKSVENEHKENDFIIYHL